MAFSLGNLARETGGELQGDARQVISGAASVAEAVEGEITFYSNPRYMPQLRRTRASAAFVPRDFNEPLPIALVRVDEPANAFQQVVLKFAPPPVRFAPGIHPTAVIAADVQLGRDVAIQPYAVIEVGAHIGDRTVIGAHSYIGHNVVIAEDAVIYPQVTIRERTRIGARVIIHSGAVIGADGFGFESAEGRHEKIPQLGIVQIDHDVEIGANTTIDRARFGRTWIQAGVKIDNLVQVGHNVIIGKHSALAAQVGIAGSTRVGEQVLMAGQVGVNGHIEIGERNIIGGQTGVTGNLPAKGGTWWGTPAAPLREVKLQVAWIHRLGELFQRVKALEKKLGR
jgi:UDP-3-O-[3-hydroxymyristoyl] glucosamine N-acyltransferase